MFFFRKLPIFSLIRQMLAVSGPIQRGVVPDCCPVSGS